MLRELMYHYKRRLCLIWLPVFLLFWGCGGSPSVPPISKIRRQLADVPTCSVILEDMKTSGNFIKDYYHKYRIVMPEEAQITDWLEVPKNYYRAHTGMMGMTLFARKDGKEITTAGPPGYAYVGDSRYGRWRTDSGGRSFWEFYGQYALLSSLYGGWYRPIYRDDYNSYRTHRSQNRIFYGRNKEFGSNGSVVRKTRPDFYSRHMARQRAGSSSFASKVSKRIGRTRSSFRGRSGGFGK